MLYLPFNSDVMIKSNLCFNLTSNRSFIIVVTLFIMILSSCVTSKKTTYLQDYESSMYSGEYTPPEDYLIQPNDNLYINVSTPDAQWSEIFNPVSGGTNMAMGGDLMAQLITYSVQLDGAVYLPYIGAVRVEGLSLNGAQLAIDSVLRDYVREPSVTVKLLENYVTVLGEVNAPGMYPMTKDRFNIFQAIALAGDVADFGDRFQLRLIRQTSDGSVIKEFDLTDKNIVDSEYFYIHPNDVIYVKPIKRKFFGMTQYPWGLLLSTVAATVSLFILIQNQVLLQQN